jgi:hypothetical protein
MRTREGGPGSGPADVEYRPGHVDPPVMPNGRVLQPAYHAVTLQEGAPALLIGARPTVLRGVSPKPLDTRGFWCHAPLDPGTAL